jgi:hypothetical protein
MSLILPPRHLAGERVIFALGRGLHRQVRGRDALLAREPGHRLRGRRFRRPHDALFAIGLARGQPVGAQHQAARGGVHGDRFVRDRELLEQQPEIFQRAGNHPIGNLFGADFEQEGKTHWASSETAP